MSTNHIASQLVPMTVEEINVMTDRARGLPPSSDQTHVLISDGEDPWIVSHQGSFYYCTVDRTKTRIDISRFENLEEMASAEFKTIWPHSHNDRPSYIEIWAPELQRIGNKWYIYFSLYNGGSGGQEHMHVLESVTDDPQGNYIYRGQLEMKTDRWAIDGTVINMPGTGKNYLMWSGWEGHTNESQNLYIASMENPWTLDSDRVCISRPEYEWEKNGYPYINEGPQLLRNENRTFIIYSASGSWTDDYCLGQLELVGDNPLDPQSWEKHPEPVFQKTDTIFGPGHCSFIKDKDGKDILIYHAQRSSGAGWARQVRYKEFTWNEDGSPNFGEPL